MDSSNSVKWNLVNLFLHRVIYVWMTYTFNMDFFFPLILARAG